MELTEKLRPVIEDMDSETLMGVINQLTNCNEVFNSINDFFTERCDDAYDLMRKVGWGAYDREDYFYYDGTGIYGITDMQEYACDHLDDIADYLMDGDRFGVSEIDCLADDYEEVDVTFTRGEIKALKGMFDHYHALVNAFMTEPTDEIKENIMAVNGILDKIGG